MDQSISLFDIRSEDTKSIFCGNECDADSQDCWGLVIFLQISMPLGKSLSLPMLDLSKI